MSKKVKLVAKQISIIEVKARREELRETYYRIRLMRGDTEEAARINAEALLQRSLTTGIVVEVAQK